MSHHREQDYQSLMLHTEAIRLMKNNPELINRALSILERWLKADALHSRSLLDEWYRILQQGDWEAALADSERGNQIRQASPCACVLPNEKRLEIMKQSRADFKRVERHASPDDSIND